RAAMKTGAPLEQGRAASDDARDFPTAAAATSAAAGKERDVCAEVAQPLEGEKNSRPGEINKRTAKEAPRDPSERNTRASEKKAKRPVKIPPGSEPLPVDGVGFVDAMHAHVDLYLACARLLKSGDEKIAQRMVERLLEMSYGKSPAA